MSTIPNRHPTAPTAPPPPLPPPAPPRDTSRPFNTYPLQSPQLSYEVVDRRAAIIKNMGSWDYTAMRAVALNESPAQTRLKLMKALAQSSSAAARPN